MPRKKNEDVVEEAKEKEDSVDHSKSLIFSQLEEQWKLPVDEIRQLVRSESPVNEKGALMALAAAKMFGLPIQGLNIIPSKAGVPQIYINVVGIRWRVQTDPREFFSEKLQVTHRPSKDEPYVEVKTTITMKTGANAEALGSVACLPMGDVPNATLKAETKSSRRAGIKLVGVALQVAEDYLEWEDDRKSKTVEGNFTVLEPTAPISEPKNLAEFFSWLQQQGKAMEDATPIVGDASVIAGNVPDAVKKLKEVWK